MPENGNRVSRHTLSTGASWFLVPAEALSMGIKGKYCRQVHLRKELSCLTKNSLRLQGIHGRDTNFVVSLKIQKILTGLTGLTRFT